MVVNGRVSQKSFGSYRSFSFFFRPMFLTFRHLCMQTENDRANMMALGVPPERIHTLGNLKFDTPLIVNNGANSVEPPLSLPDNGLLLIAGSTHQGEEEIILSAYVRLLADFPHLFLLIAPRDVSRGKEIQAMAEAKGITTIRRSQKSGMREGKDTLPRLLILDTIGELAACYRFADIAFVGGSLIRKGGHNPIEPAIMGAPVLFGPHMEDFAEISQELLTAGGAQRVGGEASLVQTAGDWLADDKSRKDAGLAALRCVERQQGVVERHLRLIQTLL
jgi:3-deoxy-D-manno-octulosonic-acid transferase